jgi:ABC-type lipopolysaccharide export system ATPase subunit
MNKRIKHNDLTHYFIREHSTLPAAYLASCEKFFKELSIKQRAASIDKKFKSFKRQASSNKRLTFK